VLFDSYQLGTTMPRGGHPPHQIQALDRTQPGLPMKPGRLGTMTLLCTFPAVQELS
jgi:hypothetical protein